MDQPSTLDWVDLPGVGRVSLVPVEQLRRARDAERLAAMRLSEQAATLATAAVEKLADAGAILVPQWSLWAVPPNLHAGIERADELVSQIAAIDRRRQDPEQHAGSGLIARISAWRRDRMLRAARIAASRELRSILIEVARRALGSGAGSAHARPVLEQARTLEAHAAEAHRAHEVCSSHAAALSQEIARREESQRHMGFDALYTAACLQRYGPPPVSSPLELKSGETAVLTATCTLARMTTRTRYVGRQAGISFPIGHTGIRYRVGSYRGQRLEQQVLHHRETGTLVISNQRLAFVGQLNSVVVQLHRVAHVDIYDDALAIFHEGRKTPDFLFLSAPKKVAFHLNWALQQARTA